MEVNFAAIREWAPVFTAIVVPIIAFLGRRALIAIHDLVNDRLDRALVRIDDLERIIKRTDDMSDPGSTAESLRHKGEP